MTIARCCRVTGRVQGVFFRVSTQRQAMRLGLAGYAHNLASGDVEVWAEGAAETVEELCAWLWQGPPASQVTHVVCEERPPSGYRDFTTG